MAERNEPIASPDIMIPLAFARWRLFHASATSAAPIGSSTPDPIPAMNRRTAKCQNSPDNVARAVNTEYVSTPMISTRTRPT
jgi:hypothetical protein